MARILIGNIKGPKGDKGATGSQGPQGIQGPQGPLPPLVNNGLATVAGVSALDAVYGKTLTDQLNKLDSNLKDIMNHTYRFSTQNTVKYISFNTVESATGPRRSIIFYYTDNADPDEQVAALWFDNVNIGFDWREHGSWVNIWTK